MTVDISNAQNGTKYDQGLIELETINMIKKMALHKELIYWAHFSVNARLLWFNINL